MKTLLEYKELLICGVLIILLALSFNRIGSARSAALIAEGRVEQLEEQRMELEDQLTESYEYYQVLRDSLDLAHDSLTEIREEAKNDALTSSVSFEENLGILRDSLDDQSSLAMVLDTLESNHLKVVASYQIQVETLEEENLMLWKRVQVTDSMWLLEQNLNQALRNEIVGLNEASDAWRKAATPNVLARITGPISYAALGVGVALLLR
jgi:hypothetical protein|tara:strand:+ start:1030 stop:1656 length:627 start_codon:yes stop_codon:yes gene_type:complete